MDENRTLPQEPQRILITIQEALMAKELLRAIEEKAKYGEKWLVTSEVIGDVLSSFKPGAARAFLEKLERLGCLEFLKDRKGKPIPSVFRLKPSYEQRLREELKMLSDP